MKTTVIEINTISDKMRGNLQIAAECIINSTCFQNEGWSSRVLADDIVNMILDSLSGAKEFPKRENLKPWASFARKNS